jgi:hypothetical protein
MPPEVSSRRMRSLRARLDRFSCSDFGAGRPARADVPGGCGPHPPERALPARARIVRSAGDGSSSVAHAVAPCGMANDFIGSLLLVNASRSSIVRRDAGEDVG